MAHLGNTQTGEILAEAASLHKGKSPRRQRRPCAASVHTHGFSQAQGAVGVTVSDFFPGSGMTCRSYRWLELRVPPGFIGFDSCTVPCVN